MSDHWQNLKLPPRTFERIPHFVDGIEFDEDCEFFEVEKLGNVEYHMVGGVRGLGFWRDKISGIVFFAEYFDRGCIQILKDGTVRPVGTGAYVRPSQAQQVEHFILGWVPAFNAYDIDERQALVAVVRNALMSAPADDEVYRL